MPLIEGIGDEVIEFFIGLIIILIGIAAWWSTRIADRPLIRTVLVFERRSQNHNNISNRDEQHEQRNYVQELSPISATTEAVAQQQQQLQQQQQQTEPDTVQLEERNNKPSTAMGTTVEDHSNTTELRSQDGSGDPSTATVHEEQNAIVQSMDSEASVLRRRRLEFFHNRPDTLGTANTVEMDSNIPTDLDETIGELNGMNKNDNSSSTESVNTTETTIDENDIRIKLKYINDDLKLVNGKLQEPLGDFKRRHFEFELANDKLVRLIFNGQVLQRDELSLQSCGMFDNCVVHCLVHQKRNGPDGNITSSRTNLGSNISSAIENDRARIHSQSATQQPGREWDLGNLFFTIVSFVLCAAWYFRYEYAQLYTVTATVALVGLTGIFTVLLVGMYFPDPDPPIQPVRS